ncbi:hypothetical protein FRC12_018485 [Ceratobasidium sp. 428]|nr:hypothetical protein FRC12_018485 [Ceratobasidium sp. 428]
MELDDAKDRKSGGSGAQILTRENVRDDEVSSVIAAPAESYRLYKRRWTGLVGLCLLNIVAGLNWLWFSSIAIHSM